MKTLVRIVSDSEKKTIQLGESLAKQLKPGSIICLFGDLGAGKTTFVKGIAKGLKIKPDAVTSPTFVFLNVYEGKLPVYHFDLYRIENIKQLQGLGFDEFCYGNGVCLIEWPQKLENLMPKEFISVELKHLEPTKREIVLSAQEDRYVDILGKIFS